MSTLAPERLRDGQSFGRYQIVRMLGEGGMGAVYEAIHTGLKKRVAVKTLLPSIAQSVEAQARFLREGEAASRINHPNVVDVTDVGTHDGVPYLVMEYLEGETLSDFVSRNGALEIPLAVDLLLPVLSAVAAGHDQGVIHRDLKPQNIFLCRGHWGDRVPKILDFGVSKIIGGENPALTGTLSVLGTASYMSPEQARGAKVVDARSDQYALGLIFYEMLTGKRAHLGDSPLEVLHMIATGAVLDPREARPDLPLELEAGLMRMLVKEPAGRHESLRAAARVVLPFASERSRMTYQAAFEDAPDGPVTSSTPVVSARGGATMLLEESQKPILAAGSPGAAGGTKLLPQSAADTTLGQGAAENTRAPTTTRRMGLRATMIAVVAAGAVVAVVLTRRGGPARIAGPVAPAPAARAAAELPRPVEPPVVAPEPRPVTAPAPASPPPASAARTSGSSARRGLDGPSHRGKKAAPAIAAPSASAPDNKGHGANNSPILE